MPADHPIPLDAVAGRLRRRWERFDLTTARELVEFSIDLDAQDDRLRLQNQAPRASPETTGAQRARSAADIYFPRYADRWQMLVDTRAQRADGSSRSKSCEPSWNVADPSRNGFGPFANAWILARAREPIDAARELRRAVYVVAIRGTVFSSRPSVVEDVFANTIAAKHRIRDASGTFLPLIFAELPGAEIHAGFGYACLSLLFDRKFGLIRALQSMVQPGASILLTGHSQGAAMATLLHALMRYAMRDGWLFSGQKMYLSSYVFAQPKPGNGLFAADFDRCDLDDGGCFTINNSLDPVPAMPLTRQSLADLARDLPAVSRLDKLVDAIARPAQRLRHWLWSGLDRQIVELMASDDLLLDPGSGRRCRAKACEFPAGSSLNYTLTGAPVPLIGDPAADYVGQDRADPFVQHHSATYRELLGRN